MSPVTWGTIEHDGPIVLVQRDTGIGSGRRRPTDRRGHPRSLKRLPHKIALALVLFTSGLALFDLYLLASSGLH